MSSISFSAQRAGGEVVGKQNKNNQNIQHYQDRCVSTLINSLPPTSAKDVKGKMQQQGKWHNPKCSSSSFSFWVCSSGASVAEEINDKENTRWEIRAEQSKVSRELKTCKSVPGEWWCLGRTLISLYNQYSKENSCDLCDKPYWPSQSVQHGQCMTFFLKDISHLKLYQSFRQHAFPIPYNLENSLLASTAGNTAQYLLSAGSHPGQWFQQAESAFWWGCSAPAHQHVPNPALLPFCQTLAVSAGTVLLPDLYLQVTPSSLPEGELLFFNNNKHHLLNTEYSYQCWLALAAQE